MIYRVEVFRQVYIHYPPIARFDVPLRRFHGIMRTSSRSKPVAVVTKLWFILPAKYLLYRLLD